MKTIWIIDHYSSEPQYGGISRQYDFAKELSKRGYKTIILSSAYSHYTYKYLFNEEYTISKFAEHAYYVYLRTSEYTENAGIGRAKNMFSFKNAVIKHYRMIAEKLERPDVVVGCSVHPLAWPAAYKIARHYGVKFIAEVRDLWPEVFLLSGKKKPYDPMIIFWGLLERWAYRRSDKIIYSMLYGDKYICDKLGFPREKAVLIGQPLDCRRYELDAGNIQMIPEAIRGFIQASFFCVFTGYYMEYEGVYVMLRAAEMLQEEKLPIKFLFVGSGQEQAGMEKYVRENGLKNVMIWSRISKEAVPALLRKADICLAHCASKGRNESFKYGISKNKVNEYMYSKACVIYGREDENDPVAASGAGYVVEPFNAPQFAEKIKLVYGMTDKERAKFGECGCAYAVEHHRVDKLVDKLLKVYEI
ncbi:glycosyltransferase family 4 protein [Sporofaciens musculi]|jgi:glycosyltransferase involved in cell wall biosynthesis|uniref:glycosyltransferase family 4 protein n=1 Tax=Sporofaciens musculi TaxID=2681861 RepID=UPI002589A1F3|nr:glycosyltransferase family 4 protein [Sporofaciens musculi]